MSKELGHESVETAAHLFIPVAGLIYATGFLTVFTFLSRFGVTEEGSEVFKAKYIYVGILYLLFSGITGMPVFSLLLMRAKNQAEQVPGPTSPTPTNLDQTSPATQREQRTVNLPPIIITANLLLVFYIYVVFAPPGFLEAREFVIPVLFLSAFASLVIIQWLRTPHAPGWRPLTLGTFPLLVEDHLAWGWRGSVCTHLGCAAYGMAALPDNPADENNTKGAPRLGCLGRSCWRSLLFQRPDFRY
jgi:hypothetical protein